MCNYPLGQAKNPTIARGVISLKTYTIKGKQTYLFEIVVSIRPAANTRDYSTTEQKSKGGFYERQ